MPDVELKLKQASAVLGVPPKDLQNLVQFGVIKPKLRGQVYRFDRQGLLRAKVALYLKGSLGASTGVLAEFMDVLSDAKLTGRSTVTIQSRPVGGDEPVEVRVPVKSLSRQVEGRIGLAANSPDLPKGRKRSDWAKSLFAIFEEMSKDLKGVSTEDILAAVRAERKRKRAIPEVSLRASGEKPSARRR